VGTLVENGFSDRLIAHATPRHWVRKCCACFGLGLCALTLFPAAIAPRYPFRDGVADVLRILLRLHFVQRVAITQTLAGRWPPVNGPAFRTRSQHPGHGRSVVHGMADQAIGWSLSACVLRGGGICGGRRLCFGFIVERIERSSGPSRRALAGAVAIWKPSEWSDSRGRRHL